MNSTRFKHDHLIIPRFLSELSDCIVEKSIIHKYYTLSATNFVYYFSDQHIVISFKNSHKIKILKIIDSAREFGFCI